jgi:hypothetical protein
MQYFHWKYLDFYFGGQKKKNFIVTLKGPYCDEKFKHEVVT